MIWESNRLGLVKKRVSYGEREKKTVLFCVFFCVSLDVFLLLLRSTLLS